MHHNKTPYVKYVIENFDNARTQKELLEMGEKYSKEISSLQNHKDEKMRYQYNVIKQTFQYMMRLLPQI